MQFRDNTIKMRTLLLLTACLYVLGCGYSCKSGKKITTAEPAGQFSEHVGTTSVPGSEDTGIYAGINKFGFELFRELSRNNDFLVYSPYSIASAMAMCYAGARENTAAEISRVMHFDPVQDSFHPAFRNLNEQIVRGMEPEGVSLKVANALWAQDDFRFLDEYFDITGTYYTAQVRNIDFSQPDKLEESRLIINEWVEDRTMEKITELIKANVLSPRTRLVLTNAIYFSGSWLFPFDVNNTSRGDFHTAPGKVTTASYMNQQKPFLYYENDDVQAVELPYKGKELVLLVILPREVMDITEATGILDHESFTRIINGLSRKTEVSLSLPRFKSSAEFVLNDALKGMGIHDAFTNDADFSGMTGKDDLFISVVVHKTFMDVNESGTEAAAATGVGMALKSSYVADPVVFTADRPFFYSIIHKETGVLLFAGWMDNPE
jgi:serpin B